MNRGVSLLSDNWIKDLYFRPQPKEKIFISEDYLDFIRGKKCLICNAPPKSNAHHEKLGGGGTSMKCDDTRAVPMCNMHHRDRHDTGFSFWDNNNIDIKMKIIEYLTEYINKKRYKDI